MRSARLLSTALLLLLAMCLAQPAVAQRIDPAQAAATTLIKQAILASPDGRHHALLRGLRSTRDAELRPLYAWLAKQPDSNLRVHGILGLAETSPQGVVDLAQLAEIDEARMRVEIIGAALDDRLLGPTQMSQLLGWNDLNQGARQAIAIRLMAEGGSVDAALFEPAIRGDAVDAGPGQLLERAIAGLGLTQLGDRRGPGVLEGLKDLQPASQRDAVRSQVVALVLRHQFAAAGPWVFSIAQDESIDSRLRDVALRAALRLGMDGSEVLWQARYRSAQGLADRLRLALIGAEASPYVRPGMYSGLPDSGLIQIDRLLAAARAVAGKQSDVNQAVASLVELGYPQANRWVVVHAREHAGSDTMAMLLNVVTGYAQGADADRDKLAPLAVEAVATMVEQDPERAFAALQPLLRPGADPTQLRIVLTGLLDTDAHDVGQWVARIQKPDDPAANDLLLLLQLRQGVEPTVAGWARIGQLIATVGRVSPANRVQLAWYYLKHTGDAPQQLQAILRQAQ